MGVHQTDVWVVLKPPGEWRKGIKKEDIISQIEPYLKTEPGLAYNFTQPIAMRVDELTSGVKSDLAIKIYGEDLDLLNRIGEDISTVVAEIAGTANFFVEQPIGQPYLTIEIDREAVASFGLNVNDIQSVIEAGIGGQVAGQLYEGQRRFDIQVRYPLEFRDELQKIQEIPVPLPNGEFIPIKRVSQIVAQEGPREIQRENGWRRLIVGVNIKNIDIGTYVTQLQSGIGEKIKIPPGYFLEYGGTFENQKRAMNHLLLVVPLSLFIIIGLLYLNFGKMRYAILILINLPFALSGGIFLLWLRGMYLSVSASIGFVALFGVAVLNGIVLIDHINELRKEGGPLRKTIIDGATDRLRPVLMTALVASLGFIPMAFNSGPGSEVQRPLATVVIGGLITSTFLTLLVLPIIYYWMEKKQKINS
jgi:cobalt-zinc-cadmium resistance protein CzcA